MDDSVITPDPSVTTTLSAVPAASFDLTIAADGLTKAFVTNAEANVALIVLICACTLDDAPSK